MSQGATGNLQFTSGSIASGYLGAGVVFSGQIASGQVGWAHHSSGAIVSGQVGNATVVSGSIASGQISTPHLASGSLTSGLMSTAFISNIGAWFDNYLDNPFGMIAQRPSVSLSSSLQYGSCDRWKASCSNVTAGTFGQNTSIVTGFSTNFSIALTGISANNAGATITVRQYIESKNANELINQTVNFSMRVYSSTSAIVSTLKIYKMNGVDDPTTLTSLGSANTTLSAGGVVTMSTGGIAMGDCSNGIVVELTIPCGVITTNNFYISDCILQIGSGVQVCERRNFQTELARCQRYYESSFNDATAPANGTADYVFYTVVALNTVALYTQTIPFKVKKRKVPSAITFYSTNIRGTGNGLWDANAVGGGGSWTSSSATASTILDQSQFGVQVTAGATATQGFSYIVAGGWATDCDF